LRQTDTRFSQLPPNGVDGAVLGRRAFAIRYFADSPENARLLLVNFGQQQIYSPAPEPLLAPPDKHEWQILWTSEAPQYGGIGTARVATDIGWTLFAETTVALQAVPLTQPRRQPKQKKKRKQ